MRGVSLGLSCTDYSRMSQADDSPESTDPFYCCQKISSASCLQLTESVKVVFVSGISIQVANRSCRFEGVSSQHFWVF